MKRTGCVLVVLVTLASVGCARRDWVSDTLTVVDVTGTWERSAQCKVIGGLNDRIVRMVLWQRGTRVTGEINALGGRLGGPIEGAIDGEVFGFGFDGPTGPYKGEAAVNGDDMSGKVDGPGFPCTIALHRLGSDR